MNLVPLIHMKNRKIYLEEGGPPITFKEFLNKIEGEPKIYIFDIDGIEKDKPNLCTYQRVSGAHELWVDFGPRNLGDVVDATMAGATDITLRKNLSPQLTISEIREITENKIYADDAFREDPSFYDFDGLVTFKIRQELESSFKFDHSFKNIVSKLDIYSYDSDINNFTYWKDFGIRGLLIDISKIQEFKNAL